MIDYAAFRREVECVAKNECPEDIREAVAAGQKITKHELKRWQEILNARGWGAPSWEANVGGTGWDIWQRLIFEEVMADNDCPPLFHHGLGQIGPVIIKFGTADQKARFLPRILDGTDWWCQGYSEPGSGSDLASLTTTARKDGDEWVINGQKTWTSHAHEANMIYMLVRTSKEERKQEGISLLLVPMDAKGIEVRPIRTIDGWHHLNEVFFTDVRVRADNLIGEVGQGWQCAKYLLERERLPAANVARIRLLHRQVKRMLEAPVDANSSKRDLSGLSYKLLNCEADIKAASVLMAGAVDGMLRQQPLGVQPSVIKMICADVAQRLTTIALDVNGPTVTSLFCNLEGIVEPGGQWVQNYFLTRSRTIAGGTTEVQRNLVAKDLFKGASAGYSPLFPGMVHDAADRFAQAHSQRPSEGAPLSEMGWVATLVPEKSGGVEGALSDVAAVAEALAQHDVQLPVGEVCVVAPYLIDCIENSDVRMRWQRELVESNVRVAPLLDASGRIGTGYVTASYRSGQWVMDGSAFVTADFDPTHFVVVAGGDGVHVMMLVGAAALSACASSVTSIDGRALKMLTFDGFVVSAHSCEVTSSLANEEVDRVNHAHLLMSMAETVGSLSGVIQRTISHLNERKQFGVQLSTFQVLRHRVAEMYVKYLSAWAIVRHCFQEWDAQPHDLDRTLSLAKLALSESSRFCSEAAIQLHGGMGMSEEVLATRMARRLLTREFVLGDRFEHAYRITHARA